ncbi:MAG: hypothetical protein KJO69_00475 [Gammaproteobacteria bacterium]|nr:hypothetical protein [Gammaproteobacteria bacterium]
MYRSVILVLMLTLSSVSAIGKAADSAPATYLLQIASNLGCETLDINLISQSDESRKNLRYTTSAFAAVELSAGTHAFGDVTCVYKDGQQTFDILSNKFAPISLSAGQAYYGGRLIFKEVQTMDVNGTPKVLSNCTQLNSRARGESSNECRDGVGVNTSAQIAKEIELYIPDVTDEDLTTIRNTLSLTKEQLLYLPLNRNN